MLNMNWGDVSDKNVKPKPSEWALNQPTRNPDSSDSDDDEHWERRAEERSRQYRKHKPHK